MAALDPELIEGEAQDFSEQDAMTDRYVAKEPLPDEVRRGFSLTLRDMKTIRRRPPEREG